MAIGCAASAAVLRRASERKDFIHPIGALLEPVAVAGRRRLTPPAASMGAVLGPVLSAP
jgi:hypothetical protein